MKACCSTSPAAPDAGQSVSVADINASCRWPLLVMFVHAAFWLVAASVLSLIASIKFHSPGFLADRQWLTYGRVHAAASAAQLYGFAIQAGLGVGLWIIAQLGGTRVFRPLIIAFGAKLWNFGTLVGTIGILAGGGTGFDYLQMPRYAGLILLLAFLIIGLWTALTLHERRERRLSPSQWFLLTALFWFPWIFSTANLLLLVHPVRGVTQSLVDWWFAGNLNFVWLSLVGLAALFHFIPKIAGRPLHSEHLALFTFWTLLLFGSWTGIPSSAPVPAWMPVLSGLATVLTLVTLLSVGVNIYRTKSGAVAGKGCPCFPNFFYFGLGMFQLAGLMRIAAMLPGVSAVTNFTWFTVAQAQLNAFGFFGMVMIGAIYCIFPKILGLEWKGTAAIRAHFWLAALGVILIAAPLAIGGVVQGLKLNDASVKIVDVTMATLPFLRASTTGELLIAVGNLILAGKLFGLLLCYARKNFVPCCRSAFAELKPAEVKP